MPISLTLPDRVVLSCRAVLFDLDGVLVDSMPTIVRQLREWAAGRGLEPDQVVELSHGRGNLDLVRLVAPALDAEREARLMEAREVDDVDGITARPGARAALEALPPAAWAVVTSGNDGVARARLRVAELPVPGVLVTADDVAKSKPDPEGYLAAAARLGARPRDCVVFEDAPAGIAAARAGGIRVVGVAGTLGTAELDTEHTVPDLASVGVVSWQ
ncbi:HAD-IA family hydrolase [Amycolatopsis rubida]|uniref:HAD-IA family hydrolase n=1 Tax=Amycolatopsis rubida TaxID=112413 RepID=A0A1I5VDY5_9PSEU|nr:MULTISPECIES: HAD-IA family hydrolase [Amycolatopsis]MYW90030.1 HAD-IA family hydrolase [Amycolatopsis rubida]NEC55007.1 HAD-IA family hydrolase [Amycolatopsis rubida]OAP21108.1 Sugar phosphatase YfbT [Amycolatopsis sp. M39]SFQ05690.1 sugar-phosphatase [Amycolatopsis rubida]